MPDVFISYAHEDQTAALEIYNRLMNDGFSVWMDEKNLLPGENWEMRILQTIQSSNFFIACLSTHSVNKQGYVQKELKQALEVADLMPEGKIYLIPVRLDDCEVPFSLRKWQWVNSFEAQGLEKLLQAIRSQVNIDEILEKGLNEFLLYNASEVLKEKFQDVPKPRIVRALLSIAKRHDELTLIRSRAARGLALFDAFDSSTWSELIPSASTGLLGEWITAWGTDENTTILDAEQIRLLFETRRLPKSSTGFGKAVRKFIKRGADYTSAVFLPGSSYPSWEVKYDCVRSIISLDDHDSMRALASFSTMSYWQARRHIIDYIEKKRNTGQLSPEETETATGILRQITSDGKSDEKTPTLRMARALKIGR